MPNPDPTTRGRVRRRVICVLLGLLLGALAPIAVWLLLAAQCGFDPAADRTSATVFGFIILGTAPVGGLLGYVLGEAISEREYRRPEPESEWRRRVMGDNERPADD